MVRGRVAAPPRLPHGYSVEACRGHGSHVDIPRGRVAAPPQRPHGYSVEACRDAAAGAAWIFRVDGSRHRRGCHVDIPRRRVAPRPRRGYSAEMCRGAATAPTWIFCGDASQRRHGSDVDIPRVRVEGRGGAYARRIRERGLAAAPPRRDSSAHRRRSPATTIPYDVAGRTQSRDWMHCIKTWPRSYVLRRIRHPLAVIVAWSGLVAAWCELAAAPVRPLGTGARPRGYWGIAAPPRADCPGRGAAAAGGQSGSRRRRG